MQAGKRHFTVFARADPEASAEIGLAETREETAQRASVENAPWSPRGERVVSHVLRDAWPKGLSGCGHAPHQAECHSMSAASPLHPQTIGVRAFQAFSQPV